MTFADSQMRCVTNMDIGRKDEVLAAIKASGVRAEWRDGPDHRMSETHGHADEYRARFGSIWAPVDVQDLSAMWAHLR